MNGKYKIAGHIVEIDSVFQEVHELCHGYASDEDAEIRITTSSDDIAAEAAHAVREREKEGLPSYKFADSYLETLAVYRKLTEALNKQDIILFHGSVIAVDGEGYLFTAKSGTGKSTHTGLWRQLLGERAVMVNDDKPLIEISEQGAVVYGTPWCGKHGLGSNISVPLKAVCILERGLENEITEQTFYEVYPMLLQQTHRSHDAKTVLHTLQLLEKLGKCAGFYRLKCNMELEAAELAYMTMK